MFIRYRRSESGAPVAKACVYTQDEHGIDPASVDPDAIRIVERLKANGHQAFIVGGAVRDLLLGRKPKDFDLVTDAHPARIKKLFRNARIIGKRFRLVHIYFDDRIYELSTFRSIANGTVGNEFGTMDEDALRRDFTFNALYFDPTDRSLVDYVGGFKDIKAKKVKPVIPLGTIFREDPVRMLRGVKYAAVSGFSMPIAVRLAIRRDAALLGGTSTSRRTEEFLKVLASGASATIVKALMDYRLLEYMAPAAWAGVRRDPSFARALLSGLEELDGRLPERHEPSAAPARHGGTGEHLREEIARYQAGERSVSVLLSHYLGPWLRNVPGAITGTHESYFAALASARDFLAPLNPPKSELEAAVMAVFSAEGVDPFRKPEEGERRKRPRRRSRGGKSGTAGALGAPGAQSTEKEDIARP